MGETLDYLESNFPDDPEEWGGDSHPTIYEVYVPPPYVYVGWTDVIHILRPEYNITICGAERMWTSRTKRADEFRICKTCRRIADDDRKRGGRVQY